MATEGSTTGTLGLAPAAVAEAPAAAEGPEAEGPKAAEEPGVRGACGRGSGALAHPRPKRVRSSCLRHFRT